MSFKFEMADVKDSFTNLSYYLADIANETAWKNEPLFLDTPVAASIRLPHPNATPKEVKANTEPFSTIDILLPKPITPKFTIEFAYSSKKAIARFSDLLQPRSKTLCDEFFAMAQALEGFIFKIQVKTIYKKVAAAKYDDIFVAESNSVTYDAVVENLKNAVDACSDTEVSEDGNVVKTRGPRVMLCRDYAVEELEQENAPFDQVVKTFHEFMLSETKIISEKEVEKSKRGRSKIEGKNKFKSILSNRADKEFYSRLSKAELERLPETVGVLLWDVENYEEKKYIRGALKLVREL